MLSITRCGDRFLLASEVPVLRVDPAIHVHLSQKELVRIVKTGMKALAAKRKAKPCRYCWNTGAD